MKLNEKRIVDYLEEHKDEYITSYQLVDVTKACDEDLIKLGTQELFELDKQAFEIGKENGFFLSKRHHFNELLGMPWNIDFKIISNDNNYFEDSLEYGSYVRYKDKIMIAYDFSEYDHEDGRVGLIPEGYNAYDDADNQKIVFVPEEETELLKPYCADQNTLNRLFRLESSSFDLAKEGKYPFSYDSESFEIKEEDLKLFCESAENTDIWTLYAWHKAFLDEQMAYCQEETEPTFTIGTLWDIFSKVFIWFDFEEDDLDLFLDWYRAYEKNKGKLLSELDLTNHQKVDFCSYIEDLAKERYPSAEENRAYIKYLDELIEKGNLWAIDHKAWGCYGGNALLECNWKEAERMLLKMYELDYRRTDAANALGYIYYSNRLGEPDHDKAFKFFSEAAESGEVEARYKLADMYRKGHGTEKDVDKAFKVYKELYDDLEESFKDGYGDKLADVALRMGYCYENGEGVEKDLAKADYYFKKAETAIQRRLKYGGAYGDDVVLANIRKALERTKQ